MSDKSTHFFANIKNLTMWKSEVAVNWQFHKQTSTNWKLNTTQKDKFKLDNAMYQQHEKYTSSP